MSNAHDDDRDREYPENWDFYFDGMSAQCNSEGENQESDECD